MLVSETAVKVSLNRPDSLNCPDLRIVCGLPNLDTQVLWHSGCQYMPALEDRRPLPLKNPASDEKMHDKPERKQRELDNCWAFVRNKIVSLWYGNMKLSTASSSSTNLWGLTDWITLLRARKMFSADPLGWRWRKSVMKTKSAQQKTERRCRRMSAIISSDSRGHTFSAEPLMQSFLCGFRCAWRCPTQFWPSWNSTSHYEWVVSKSRRGRSNPHDSQNTAHGNH